jgi:hypothetical protein
MKRYAYALLLVALLGIILSPLLLHPGYLLYPRDSHVSDLTITHWPAVAFNVRSLRQDAQIPLWRTTIASGGPWAANPQSWLYYPPAWLFFLLPINVTFNLLLLVHLLLAALATYAFARHALDLNPRGAVLAGLAFALAPWVSGQLSAGHVNIVLALAWLPVALLGAHEAVTTGRAGGALLAGIAWSSALLNHFQMAAFIAALTVAWYLFVTFARHPALSWMRQIGLLLLITAVALSLSAVLLIPLAEALPYLNRAALTADEAGLFSLSWGQLLAAIIPTYGGQAEQLIYLGLPLAILATIGLVLKGDRVTWFLVIVTALAVIFALGTYTPLFPVLIRWIPGMSLFRVPPRAWILVAFGLALLAGRGLDALSAGRLSSQARHRVTLVSLVILTVTLTLAVGLLIIYRPVPPAAWVMAALAILVVPILVLRAQGRIRPALFAIAILILTAIDLGLVHFAWTEMRAPADAFAWGAEPAGYLAQQPDQFRSYSPSYSLPQHTALQHDLYLADGVDPIQLGHYADFLASAGGYQASGYSPTLPPVLDDSSAQPNAAQLGLLNVAYVATGYPITADGLVLHERLGETYIYRNERVLPRAFVIPPAQTATRGAISDEALAHARPANVTIYTPNRLVVDVQLEAPGLLVLSEVWYPGWRALVDGMEAPVQRVEETLRGIILDPGSHIVELRYSPWTAWVGLTISAFTGLSLLAYAAFQAWRRS